MRSQPIATYRLQLHAGFTLVEAAAIVDYLNRLGVSHLYCSPYLQAVPGSTHGYDVVDHQRINAELGGMPALERLDAALRKAGMGQVLDIVPNHMAISASYNPWWWDVLENGPSSLYAFYFDVEWDPPEARHANQVLIPILGDQYGRVLEAGEIRVEFLKDDGRQTTDDGGAGAVVHRLSSVVDQALFTVRYYDNVYPVDPRSLSSILASAAERAAAERGAAERGAAAVKAGDEGAAALDTLTFLAGALDRLPEATASDPPNAERRSRDQEVLYNLLRRLIQDRPELGTAIQEVVDELNQDPDALDVFLSLQNYRLAFWRMASHELGYRRFFDINTLIGLRMEDERVFRDTHRRILELIRRGMLDGLRIDHPDGLRDPEGYFERLHAVSPDTWILIEKIVEPGEKLPEEWPVAGTSGYDFMYRANALFVDPDGEGPLSDFYTRFTGRSPDYPTTLHEKKIQVMNDVLGSDVNRLTFLWMQICERHRRFRDYTLNALRDALIETAACLPVYRTYVRADQTLEGVRPESQVRESDREYIEEATGAAKANRPDLDPNLFDFLRDLLLLRVSGELEGELAMRFQQFTGPAMAKGVEDTTFYNYYRLVSLNEVGGSPGQFGNSVDEFHRACAETQLRWPRSLLATTTHDTKRSEDVRARINLLSEIPDPWIRAVQRWSAINEPHRSGDLPDRNDEYLLYQTLVGAWPINLERLQPYLEKAIREAKTHTSWTDPDPEYEAAVVQFTKAVLDNQAFRKDFEAFLTPLIEPGRINSLAQTLLKLTTPGVPDLYQGAELWTDSLVDPDNRRPVDYELRRRLLDELSEEPSPQAILSRIEGGLPKLWVVRQALALRRRLPQPFGKDSSYQPLPVGGSARASEHAVAYLRGDSVAVVVPRLVMRRQEIWPETIVSIPAGTWQNELTGERVKGGNVRLSDLLNRFPVCLLSNI